jgi:hypothetical protein
MATAFGYDADTAKKPSAGKVAANFSYADS